LEGNGVNGLHKGFKEHDINVVDDPNGEVCDFDYYGEQFAPNDSNVASPFQYPLALKPFNEFLQKKIGDGKIMV